MTLPSSPPHYASWAGLLAAIRVGESGWRPYSLQAGLGELGAKLELDGAAGPATKAAVIAFQERHALTPDGIAGAATQGALLAKCSSRTHAHLADVPDGLMRGFAEGEGANVLAATNWTIGGGVDCGPMQFRVYGPPYSNAKMRSAFNPMIAMIDAGNAFVDRAAGFYDAAWIRAQGARRRELSKRCAVLAHNWPAGARAIASHGTCYRPGDRATWVSASTRFPDGTPVRTCGEWCEFYAMGGPHGEGAITKYVKSWA